MLLALFLICACVDGAVTGRWDQFLSQSKSRYQHRQSRVNAEIFCIFGGRGSDGTMIADPMLFNITSNRFVDVLFHGHPPPSVSDPTFVTVGTKQYMFGGLVSDYPLANYDFFEIDTVTWQSYRLPSSGGVPGRYRHASIVMGTTVYIAFGITRGVASDMWAYNTETQTWASVAYTTPAPSGRFNPCCNSINATAFVCFGGTLYNTSTTNEVIVFDTVARRWDVLIAVGDGPASRRSAACYVDDVKGVFTISQGASAEIVHSDMWDLDLTRRVWSRAGDVPARDDAMWTVMGRSAFQFGGFAAGRGASSEMWVQSLDTKQTTLMYPHEEKPSKRFLHCVVKLGFRLYILLGAADAAVFDDVWFFDTVSGKFTRVVLDGPKFPRSGAVCVALGSYIIVHGGNSNPHGLTLSSDLHYIEFGRATSAGVYVAQSRMAPVGAESETPAPRYQHAAVGVLGNLIVYGGLGSQQNYLSDMWVFLGEKTMWVRVFMETEIRIPRVPHSVITLLANGRFLIDTNDATHMYVMTIQTNKDPGSPARVNLTATWQRVAKQGEATPRHGSVAVNGDNSTSPMFFGGSVDVVSSVQDNSSRRFNMATGQITTLPNMPVPVTQAGGTFLGRSVYIFGGRVLAGGAVLDPTSAFQRFTLDLPSVCPTSDDSTDNNNCVPCARGFLPPTCEPCKQNTFFENGVCNPCSDGTDNRILGIVGARSCVVTMNKPFVRPAHGLPISFFAQAPVN